jgi:hypothetical protein
VTNVNSADIRCYQLAPGNEGATTQEVKAGSTLTWNAAPNIYHVGALSAYMAKAPAGTKAADWDGDGQVWFKVYQDMPTVSGGQYNWPSEGKKNLSQLRLFFFFSALILLHQGSEVISCRCIEECNE